MVGKNEKKFYFFVILFCTAFLIANVQSVYAKKNRSSKKISKQKTVKSIKSAKKNQQTSQKIYTLRRGDTLVRIAKVNGCDVETLKKLNPSLDPKRLKPGIKIKLPVSVADTKKSVIRNSEIVYKVKKGDTLHSIAKRFNLSTDEIKQLNKINDEHIVAGMNLLIKNLDKEKDEQGVKKFYSLTDVDDEDFGEDAGEGTKELTLLDDESNLPKTVMPPFTLTRDKLDRLLSYSLDFLGTDYKYGGNSVFAIDCSAFVKTVFKEIDINLPRTSREQFTYGVNVSLEELREGDLLFFAKKKRINHVGIYIGNDMFIHAARKGKGVIITKMDSPYVKKHFVGAKRIFSLEGEKQNIDLKKDLSLAEKPLVN